MGTDTSPANGNMTAFLGIIKHAEGTDKAPNPYAVTFGYQFTITDFSDHPHALGWPGYLWNGIHETASGAYQITFPTWIGLKKKLNLPDFSPASQDAAAVLLIAQIGAMHLVDGGQIAEAIAKCSSIWASLPGIANTPNPSGQPTAQTADLIQVYTTAGGVVA